MEKTCGNCALRKVCNPNPEVPCVGWTESAESALQRYAQLEQVVKGLMGVISQLLGGTPLFSTHYPEIKRQLEALEVSMDD